MKILQLCPRVPFPSYDGGTIAMQVLADGFLTNGQELKVMALNTSRHFVDKERWKQALPVGLDFDTQRVDTDISLYGLLRNLLSSDSYHITRFYSSSFAEAVKQELKAKRYDLVILDGLQMAAYLKDIRKSTQAKVVLRAHNVEHLIWQRMANAAVGLKSRYLNLLADRLKSFELDVLQKVDALLPITPDDASCFRTLGCEKPMHVTPVGVKMDKYRIDEQAVEHPTLFHFGSMDWLPNEEAVRWFLDRCMDLLLAQLPTIRFDIAGRNMPAWLKAYHHPNVRIVENVSDPVVYMNSRSIMLVPLLSGSGMRVKIMEGLAMGKAIVSTTIGAEGINVEHGQSILLADSPHSFVQAIVSIVNDPSLYERLRNKGRELAESVYASERIGLETVNFLASL